MTKLLISQTKPEDADQPAAINPEETKGMTPQQELRHLKLKLGTWNLVPSLITQKSVWERDLIFEGGRSMWTFYTKKTKEVKTCGDVRDHVISMVGGGWQKELADILAHFCYDMPMLQKLYADSDDCTQEHFDKHFTFMTSLLGARAKSLVAQFCKPPYRYAGLCKHETKKPTQEVMQSEWLKILEIEEEIAKGKGYPPMSLMHFVNTPWCRLFFLANERDLKLNTEDAILWAQAAIENVGDTIVIENSHQKVKDLLQEARHSQVSRAHKFQAMINSGVLEGRNIPTVSVSDYAKASASAGKDGGKKVVETTHPNKHKMAKAFQNVMKWKGSSPNFTWPSSSHSTLFGEGAALEFCLSTGLNAGQHVLDSATMVCLVGAPGSLLASNKESCVVMVVAVSTFNFLGWTAHVTGEVDGFNQVQLCHGPQALQWFYIEDLDEWLSIPAKPVLQNRYGPLVLLQTGQPLPLLHARILQGLALTNKQAETVLKHYQQKPQGKAKKALYMQLFELFLESPEEMEEALKRSNCNVKEAEEESVGDLSDYQDLLDFVEEAGNLGDPELKQEKTKVLDKKFKRAKAKALKELDEKNAEKKKRGRKKGKGKGKGKKSKAKAKSRGKGKKFQAKKEGLATEDGLQKEAEEKARLESEEKLRKELEERLRTEVEERLRKEAEERLRKEAERLKKEAEEERRLEAKEKERKEKQDAEGRGSQRVKRNPKLHESPDILPLLCPPDARIILNHNDHRPLTRFCV